MTNVLSELGGIAANTVGETVAFAAGTAGHTALSPISEAIAQVAWSEAPIRLPVAQYLALGVAQGQVDEKQAQAWALKQGYDVGPWQAMVSIANVGPALGYAFAAWRRDQLTEGEFNTAMHRSGLEPQWWEAIRSLKHERLDLGALTTAVHRGLIAGQGLIVKEPPAGSGTIPRPPQSPIDATTEAAAHGIDAERLRVLIGNTGLPLSLGEMLRLKNMGKVHDDDVRVAVAESNIRNEYMDVALALGRRLLTPHEYAEAELRGILHTHEAQAGAALSGVEPEDYHTLFEIMGRPLNVHAITTGEARGAKLGGTYDAVPEPYRDAIRRSNIRPEYAELAYANRYTYPSAFAIRGLAQAGTLTEGETHETLLRIGWPPDFAAKVATAWATTKAGGASSHTSKAQTQLWTATHKAYVVDEVDDATAGAKLEAAGVPPAETPAVLALWRDERELVRLTLTPTQVKKAYGAAKYSRDEAVGYLERLGMSAADAGTLLDE